MGDARSIGRAVGAVIGLVALLTLAAPTGAAAQAPPGPIVGPDLPVSHPVPGSPEPASTPALAFGGDRYLAVWNSSNVGIRATRVNRDGSILDQPGLLVEPQAGGTVDVASDGADFLVVWEGRFGGIFARPVSRDGRLVGTAATVISGSEQAGDPSISFDGTNYLVVWSGVVEGGAGDTDILGARVQPDGTVLDPGPLVLAAVAEGQDGPDVAFDGSHHLVTWQQYDTAGVNHIHATLVTPAGTTPDPDGFPIATGSPTLFGPAVTVLGTSFFVAWYDLAGADVFGTRVDPAGTVLDPAGIPIAATTEPESGRPALASDGVDVLVVFTVGEATPALRAVRVDGSGTVLDDPATPIPAAGSAPVAAFDGTRYFVAGNDDGTVRGSRVTPALAVLDPTGVTLATTADSQTGVELAFDGTNHLTVWTADPAADSGRGIFGARVGPDGQILDGTGFRIAAARGPRNEPIDPSVAFDGANHLVTWAEERGGAIQAARVSPAGAVLDRFTVAVAGPGEGRLSEPRLASGAGTALVVWRWVSPVPEPPTELRAARVSPAGEVLDPTHLLLADEPGAGSFDVAFGATDFLVVWRDRPDLTERGIVGLRVTPAGSVPEPEGFVIHNGDRDEQNPRVAWNGQVHLVVWEEVDGFLEASSDIVGARVDGSGAVLDPDGIPISTAPGGQHAPEVGANGPFLVTWADRRRGLPTDTDLFATKVDPDGTVSSPDGFELVHGRGPDGDRGAPVATATQDGSFVVAHERFVVDAPHATYRAFTRRVQPK